MFREKNGYTAFDKIIQAIKESINCALPCKVDSFNGKTVDVLMIRNDELEDIIISNVKLKMPETQRAYIFLGLKKGDRGTLTFFDKSVENYVKGEEAYNGDDRCHSLQDRCFSLGFVPDNEAFIYPINTDIEIGLKDGSAKINLTSGNITINGGNVNITGSSVNLGSNTTIDGKMFLEHTHSNGNNGGNTGGVV